MTGPALERITGSNFAYQHLSLERFLDDMATLDREHLELWGVAPHLHIPAMGLADVRNIHRLLRERGLAVECLTPEQVAYPVNLASSTGWLREQSIRMFHKAVDVCVELESPLLFLTAGRGLEDEPVQDAWDRAVESLGSIVDYAGANGVGCVLEPLQRTESNLVNDVAGLQRMLEDIGSANLGVALDTVAMAVAGETVNDYGEAFGSLVRHVHLIDGAPAGHLAWGDGELPLGQYLSELAEIGYSGFMTFELFGDGRYALEPLSALRRCMDAVASAEVPRHGSRRSERQAVFGSSAPSSNS